MRGATLRGRYAASTESSSGERPDLSAGSISSVAFHCRKRAGGELTGAPSSEVMAPDHALQFCCGRSRLPLRVSSEMRPPAAAPLKLNRPQRENKPASKTSDS